MIYWVRKARIEDFDRINEIYIFARNFMDKSGNPDQWGKTYPSDAQILQDIFEENLYVICDDNVIHGVFYFWIGPDPTYLQIFDGAWRSHTDYGTIHRIAGDGSGKILQTAISFAQNKIRHLRIDTHHNNFIMQKALAKQGFQRCGIIFTEDASPRIAYDYLEE